MEGRRESVLDYVIGDEMGERMMRMKIEERVDLDHAPVMIWGKENRRKGKEKEKGEERGRGTEEERNGGGRRRERILMRK